MFIRASSRCRLPSSLGSFHRSTQSLKLHNNVTPGKTVVEQFLLDNMTVRSSSQCYLWLLLTVKLKKPLPMSTYMMQCLLHPTNGYYMNPKIDVVGSRREVTTNPEVRELFGEVWPGFLKVKLNGNELKIILENSSLLFGFWSNTKSQERIFLSE